MLGVFLGGEHRLAAPRASAAPKYAIPCHPRVFAGQWQKPSSSEVEAPTLESSKGERVLGAAGWGRQRSDRVWYE